MQAVTAWINNSDLAAGMYVDTITIAATGATNTSQTVAVTLTLGATAAQTCSGTCYYVANNGSNSNNGTSPATPGKRWPRRGSWLRGVIRKVARYTLQNRE